MLKVNEIFFSIQGESTYSGLRCGFVRLSGCNLRCSYCDTKYAYEEGDEQSIGQVVAAIARFPAKLVEITGGEPLLQSETPALITTLADRGYTVLIETNGSVPLRGIDTRAVSVMDIKCPGSGMSDRIDWDNVGLLRPHDEIKFVLTDRADFEWSLEVLDRYGLHRRHVVHLAPAFGVLEPSLLASWMLEAETLKDASGLRLNLQLHRYIWPDVARGV